MFCIIRLRAYRSSESLSPYHRAFLSRIFTRASEIQLACPLCQRDMVRCTPYIVHPSHLTTHTHPTKSKNILEGCTACVCCILSCTCRCELCTSGIAIPNSPGWRTNAMDRLILGVETCYQEQGLQTGAVVVGGG